MNGKAAWRSSCDDDRMSTGLPYGDVIVGCFGKCEVVVVHKAFF